MTGSKRKQVVALLLGVSLSTLWSYQVRRDHQGAVKMPDFAEIYFGARCAILHQDPYNPGSVARVFLAENPKAKNPLAAESARIVITIGVNLPTTLFATAPLALLPWPVAQNLWMLLTAALLALAAILVCDLAPGSPVVSACMAAFLLANCEELLILGNLAGVVIGLCIVAAWCFLRNRYAFAGVALLAISLVLKPHDSGLVWLYFLLAGGTPRKRALQTLALTAVLGLFAALWISSTSPHWIQELHNNLLTVSAPGSTSDPALVGMTNRSAGQISDLQAAFSIFKNDPRFYNPASYLIAGSVILTWIIAVLRQRFSVKSALIALAAIAPLSILPVYHRIHDAKIILLTIPACAALWAGKGPRRWIALALTSAAILVTSDIPLLVLLELTRNLPGSPSTLTAKITDLVLLQPAPLLFLATGCFYLWVYLCAEPTQNEHPQLGQAAPPVQLESRT
ncbi:MAG TPA: glycosyltransferase 87 family protein [Terracidiphilus sp.]